MPPQTAPPLPAFTLIYTRARAFCLLAPTPTRGCKGAEPPEQRQRVKITTTAARSAKSAQHPINYRQTALSVRTTPVSKNRRCKAVSLSCFRQRRCTLDKIRRNTARNAEGVECVLRRGSARAVALRLFFGPFCQRTKRTPPFPPAGGVFPSPAGDEIPRRANGAASTNRGRP